MVVAYSSLNSAEEEEEEEEGCIHSEYLVHIIYTELLLTSEFLRNENNPYLFFQLTIIH